LAPAFGAGLASAFGAAPGAGEAFSAGLPLLFSAARASDSSTLDAAAFASTPAAFSAARSSLEVTPWAFAIS
jgi:hypothetical protein